MSLCLCCKRRHTIVTHMLYSFLLSVSLRPLSHRNLHSLRRETSAIGLKIQHNLQNGLDFAFLHFSGHLTDGKKILSLTPHLCMWGVITTRRCRPYTNPCLPLPLPVHMHMRYNLSQLPPLHLVILINIVDHRILGPV